MKKPLIYLITSLVTMMSCQDKADQNQDAVLAIDVLDQIEEEVTMPLIKGVILDQKRNRLLYDIYYKLDRIIEISEHSMTTTRVDSFHQAIQVWDQTVFSKYGRSIGLSENYQSLVIDRTTDCSDECVKTLLRAYLISIGAKLTDLVDNKSISLDSLSFVTKQINDDSILIYPVLYNETQMCYLVVDEDSLGRMYNSIGLTNKEFETATEITVGIKNREGKIMEIKIK